MMDIFEGFSEEEIRSLSTQKSTDEKKVNATNNNSPTTGVYKNQHNKNRYHNRLPRKNVARERLLKGNCKLTADSKHDHLPKEARLSIPKIPEEEEYESDEPKDKTKNITKIPATTLDKNSRHENETNAANIKTNQSTVKNCNENNINSETSTQNRNENDRLIGSCVSHPILNSEVANIDSLEQFQTRQKLMEEQNRQRKEILRRALADRAKKTHEEVKRLNEIEGELKKLDLLLSNDVAIIRNQIENASIDFMEAQKRYDRAEKEFLDAKLELFNKKERKELLTNHLCTIIEQNEMRKAKKLSDLMTQLEIAPKNSIITSQIEIEYKKKEEENEEGRKEEQLSTNKNDIHSKQTETDINDKKEIITSDS